jgi:hypothetical protein
MASHGTPEMLREVIAEHLQLVALHADLGVGHATAGDDAGLAYSVRKVTAYLRVVAATTADLIEQAPQTSGRPRREWTT